MNTVVKLVIIVHDAYLFYLFYLMCNVALIYWQVYLWYFPLQCVAPQTCYLRCQVRC